MADTGNVSALDYDTMLTWAAEADIFKTCELLDGNISPCVRIFPLCEVLFQPSLLGEGASGDEVRH